MNAHDTLTQVNSDINTGSQYETEIGEDAWAPAVPGQGADCDSYATAKAQKLFELGWSVEWMRLATCWVEVEDGGGYHCVLLIDMGDGQTWVLDNRKPLPTQYQLLNYTWHKIQIPGTNRWVYSQQFIDNL